jgi:mono/diheme cytochrome c family protein
MRIHQPTAVLLGAVLALGCLLSPSLSMAQKKLVGSEEFEVSCAVCHGPGGHGNGVLAEYLIVEPSDLTQLARKNDGRFPFLEVFQMIDGRQEIAVHGTRAMPIWGDRYKVEAALKYGPYNTETVVRGRILELVQYLEAIQR